MENDEYDYDTDLLDIEVGVKHDYKPVDVKVIGEERELSAEYGSWQTFSWPAGTNTALSAQRILPLDRKRARADVWVQPTVPIPVAPPVPATGVAQANYNAYPVTVTIVGGNVTVIAVNGNATGLTAGSVSVPPGGSITLTYTVAPTWTWSANTVDVNPGYVLIGSYKQIMNNSGGRLFPGRYPVENIQETWVASDGVTGMQVVVLQERYGTP